MARALAGIKPNISNPKQSRQALLSLVVRSLLLYGASIWADALHSNTIYGNTCRQACRTGAHRVARVCRTISGVAVSVIAGILPIDFVADERAEKYHGGVASEEDCDQQSRRFEEEWQRRWDSASEGRYTRRVIPNVAECISTSSPTSI